MWRSAKKLTTTKMAKKAKSGKRIIAITPLAEKCFERRTLRARLFLNQSSEIRDARANKSGQQRERSHQYKKPRTKKVVPTNLPWSRLATRSWPKKRGQGKAQLPLCLKPRNHRCEELLRKRALFQVWVYLSWSL